MSVPTGGALKKEEELKTRKGILSAGALFMGLVVMLGLIGLVNGLWSKNLVIHGTVETGDLNADWDCGWTNDDGLVGVLGTVQGGGCPDTILEPDGDSGLDPNNFDWPNFVDWSPFVRKDVGECHLEIGDRNTGEGSFGAQVAYVDIVNAYPSYECTITMFLTNTGSIPFNVIGAQLKLPPEAVGIIETGAVNAAGNIVDLCDPSILQDVQVDPGQELRLPCTVHVTERAAQSTCTGAITTTASGGPTVENENCDPATTYHFAIDVCVAQWNEAATPAQCKNPVPGIHEGPPETTFPD
jgi:hypothetical protein